MRSPAFFMLLCFLFASPDWHAQVPQSEGQKDPDVMLDIGVGASTIGAAFYVGCNLNFGRLVITPNHVRSASKSFEIFAGSFNKFRSSGVLVGWTFPGGRENDLFVVSTGFSYNTLIAYGSSGLFRTEKIGSESSFGWPVHAKLYVPTKSGIGFYAGARLDLNGIDEYVAFTVGIRIGKVGHWE